MRFTPTLALTLFTSSLFAISTEQIEQTIHHNFQTGHPHVVVTPKQDNTVLWHSINMPYEEHGMVIVQTEKAPNVWFAYPQDKHSYAKKLYRSTNSGKTWHALRLPDNALVSAVVSFDRQHLMLGTTQGMYLSKDEGNHWLKANAGLPEDSIVQAIRPINEHQILILTNVYDRGDNIFRSDDEGHHWAAASLGLNTSLNGYRSLAVKDDIIILGLGYSLHHDAGGLYISRNNGDHWSQPSSNWCAPYISSVAINSQHDLFVVSDHHLFKTDMDGKTWIPLADSIDNIATIKVDNTDRLYLYVGEHSIYRSDDNGQTWKFLKQFDRFETEDLHLLNDDRILVSGRSSTWLSDKNQKHFHKKSFPAQGIYELATDKANIWLLSQRKLYQRPKQGGAWIKNAHEGALSGLVTFKEQLVIADANAFYNSQDQGQHWQQSYVAYDYGAMTLATSPTHLWAVHAPLYYAQNAYTTTDLFNWQQVTDSEISALYAEDEQLYSIREQQIKKSTDNGLTWQVLLNLSVDANVSLTAYAKKFLLATIDRAGIIASSDGGAHWRMINQGLAAWYFNTVLMLDENNYLVGTNHGVYITHDAGQHWLLANRGLANLRINKLYRDQNTVYAATDTGLYQTTI